MNSYKVNALNKEQDGKEEVSVEADGYAVDNNSNLFFFNEEPNLEPQGMPKPPKPTTTFAHDTWFRVEKA